jgi:hypothetical protein
VSALSRFSSLQEFVSQDKIISGDKFLTASRAGSSFNYIKRDFLYKSGTWRHKESKALILNRKSYTLKNLVMGHSDISTGKMDGLLLRTLGIPKLYAVNSQPIANFSESIPLGITNDCDDSPIHRILGNVSHFLEADSTGFNCENFTPSIYINFTSGNNSSVRNRLLSIVNEISPLYEVTIQSPEFTNIGRVKYLEDLRSKGLILCPEGNGVDTHRFWETLYMGGTPVVISNPKMQNFYDNLPVIQICSWRELFNISELERLWWQLSEKTYNFELLSADYWIKRFSTK